MRRSPTAKPDLTRDQQDDRALLQALATPAMYPGAPPVELHETHASWVFVAGERAYKVKKPLALGFLDYSTLALRHSACREEVRVNQELAPGIYLGVRALVSVPGGGYRIAPDGSPGAVEYLVEMRAFREQDTFAGLIDAGALESAHVEAAARLLAGFHHAADVVLDWDADTVRRLWLENIEELRQIDPPQGWQLDVAAGFGEAFVAAHACELNERAKRGLARDGHGDLRCEHVLARPTVRIVDRIEFNPSLRRGDVAFDLAFLAMDLEASGQAWAAQELIGAYRDAGMDPAGETLRSFYEAHWALVRAKVTLIAAAERDGDARAERLGRAQEMFSLCERLCWRARSPLALVVCGPAASGKSSLAGELSRRSGIPVASSDALRKRIARIPPTRTAGPDHYSDSFTRATYEQLTREALLALQRQRGVIVDATCRSRSHRAGLLSALRETGVPVLIVRCEVPLALAVERAERRLHEPGHVSDATPEIAAEQFQCFEELDEDHEGPVLALDTTPSLDVQVAQIASSLDGHGLGGASADPGEAPEA